VQFEPGVFDMRILVDMVHTLRVERGRTALDTVDDVAFFKQKFGEVRAVLSGDASDEGDFGLGHVFTF
jgi:hypothetical protein